MTIIQPRPRLAEPADMEGVCDTLARAFAQGPVAEWVQPDPAARLDLYRAFARVGFPQALHEAEVWMTEDYAAVAVWYQVGFDRPRRISGNFPDDLARLDEVMTQAMAELATPDNETAMLRLAMLDHEVVRRHPTRPHHHLAFIGVRPGTQGFGIGSVMLEHHHSLYDPYGETSWLVATSQEAARLYQRHGYDVLEEFTFGPDTPTLVSMRREPSR